MESEISMARLHPQVAIDQMLVPVFKSYAKAWDDFHKTPSKAMPSLADIWQRERDELVKSITTSGASASGDSAEVKALKDQQAEMKKQMSALRTLVHKKSDFDDTASHDGDRSEAGAKKRAKNKAKRQAATAALKEKKEREAAESGDEAARK